MSALDELSEIVETMRSRKAEITAFEGLLTDISTSPADILAAMEKPAQDAGAIQALAEGLRNLTIKAPDITVQAAAAPKVDVTVQPAQVVVMPPETQAIKGWKLVITNRDGNGAIREISFRPEV